MQMLNCRTPQREMPLSNLQFKIWTNLVALVNQSTAEGFECPAGSVSTVLYRKSWYAKVFQL
jgi:hypothetical protein